MTSSRAPTLPSPHAQKALIVFARPPVPGRVKTRLTELLTDVEAATLYEAFLRDAFAQYAHLNVAVRLYLAGNSEALSSSVVPEDVQVFLQRSGGLGVRMAHAFEETFAAGFERVVILGTDHPTLPTAYVKEAFAALDVPDAAPIGPSSDGGYYLLGLRRPYPSIFEGMTYSHARVFEETCACIRAAGARPVVLPRWYDVDTPDDLKRLAADFQSQEGPASHTRRQFAVLKRRYPALRV